MTETSPLDTNCGLKPEAAALDFEGRLDLQIKQGVPSFGVEMKVTDCAKDVIKSGGEWISTIDLMNLAAATPT